MSSEFKNKFINTLLVTSAFSLTLFLFGPLYLYFTNISEFNFLLADVWYLFTIILLLSIVLIILTLLPLKPSIHKLALSLVFALAFLLWLQGNILVWKYGLLDGREINWNDFRTNGYIDSIVWFTVLIFAIIKRNFVSKIIVNLSIGLVLIQLISISIACFKAPEQPVWKGYSIDETTKYTFSEKNNVIVIVLDSFQTDIFQEIIDEDIYYKDIFTGFTYFRNALGGYPVTDISVPLILTGKYYDNSTTFEEYKSKAYTNDSIPAVLKEKSYQVDLYPYPGLYQTMYFNENVATNIKKTSVFDNETITKLTYLYDANMFRYMPQFVKKKIHNNPIFSLNKITRDKTNYSKRFPAESIKYSYDVRFIDKMISDAVVNKDIKTFKFYHLYPPHWPLVLNEALEYGKMDVNRANYKRQAKASLEIMRIFLDKLRDMGAYDNSMIIIVGDHGAGIQNQDFVLQKGMDAGERYSTLITDKRRIAALPLVLVKPFSSSGDLKISDAPVSLSDVPKTIFDELGIKSGLTGMSMFSVRETDTRERRYLYYDHIEYPYYGPMEEYIITGFGWLNESWKPTHFEYTSEGIKDNRPTVYSYGSNIDFGEAGNAKGYFWFGWSGTEKDFTWTDGKKASLLIPIIQPHSDLILKAVLNPLLSSTLTSQRVKVYINGSKLGDWNLNAGGEYTMVVPKDFINGPFMEISFELPDAASPIDLGIGEDTRTLGIAVRSIVISQLTAYQYGSVIQFGIGNAKQYQGTGWSEPENGFTWTNDKSATLVIPISKPQSDLTFKAYLNPFVSDKHDRQRVIVYINDDNKIGELFLNEGGEYIFTIPQYLVNDSPLRILFELPDAKSPLELGISSDNRTLGIAMQSVILLEK